MLKTRLQNTYFGRVKTFKTLGEEDKQITNITTSTIHLLFLDNSHRSQLVKPYTCNATEYSSKRASFVWCSAMDRLWTTKHSNLFENKSERGFCRTTKTSDCCWAVTWQHQSVLNNTNTATLGFYASSHHGWCGGTTRKHCLNVTLHPPHPHGVEN